MIVMTNLSIKAPKHDNRFIKKEIHIILFPQLTTLFDTGKTTELRSRNLCENQKKKKKYYYSNN